MRRAWDDGTRAILFEPHELDRKARRPRAQASHQPPPLPWRVRAKRSVAQPCRCGRPVALRFGGARRIARSAKCRKHANRGAHLGARFNAPWPYDRQAATARVQARRCARPRSTARAISLAAAPSHSIGRAIAAHVRDRRSRLPRLWREAPTPRDDRGLRGGTKDSLPPWPSDGMSRAPARPISAQLHGPVRFAARLSRRRRSANVAGARSPGRDAPCRSATRRDEEEIRLLPIGAGSGRVDLYRRVSLPAGRSRPPPCAPRRIGR